MLPDFTHEQALGGRVAGIDEAGRGPLAGPVVAAAVCFHDRAIVPAGITDSKKLSARKREALFEAIYESASVGVGLASVEEIDTLNILGATKLAMQRAVGLLLPAPEAVLVDGNQPPKLPMRTVPLVKGDSLSLSIAAASIIAKVTRDRLMLQLDAAYPHYGWAGNAGYGTAAHLNAITTHGITPHHRRSFEPIKSMVSASGGASATTSDRPGAQPQRRLSVTEQSGGASATTSDRLGALAQRRLSEKI